jgi:hypothetical protein
MHAGGQLPLALRYPPDQRLDTFTDAPAGALAQLRALAESASADWLYLNGPAGVGKTHLALATCAAAEAFGRRAVYVPLGAAKGRLQDALEAMHGNDVVALDGVDLIAGSRADELALFDFHNRARSAGVSLLYAARSRRMALPSHCPTCARGWGNARGSSCHRWTKQDGDASCAGVRSVADWNWMRPRWIGCCGASGGTCSDSPHCWTAWTAPRSQRRGG